MTDTIFEQHYTIQQLAKTWGWGVETVRPYVDAEDDVCRIPGKSVTSTVPISVARRIHTKMLAGQPAGPLASWWFQDGRAGKERKGKVSKR